MTDHERADWTALRTEYMTGNMTLKALALKHEVSLVALSHRAVVESWELKRAYFRERQACVQKVDRVLDY